jgi:hypothetical protein
MSSHKKQKSASKGQNQTPASRRTANPPGHPRGRETCPGAGFQEQDAKRRLGSFEGAGEHGRTGSRGHQ